MAAASPRGAPRRSSSSSGAAATAALSAGLLALCVGHALSLEFTVAEKEEWYTAFINITYPDPVTAEPRTDRSECGRYGEHSPKKEARGLVLLPTFFRDRQGCHINVKFPAASRHVAWVALIAAGNCTFREKISNAASRNASAVVIYNVGSHNPNDTITMPHQGTGDIIAVMIPEPKGQDIVALLEQSVMVMMDITVGTRNLQKYVSRTSVVFVSISFIVLMTISLAWLVFYYIQRFRYVNARDRNQRRLGDAAKKAISRLQVRTIKKGDKEIDSDFDSCAVCIESYKPNDVVRILPCRHLFHKHCIDPWLQDQRTCPMCKTNILKALGIMPNADDFDEIPPEYEASVGAPPTDGITGASEMAVNESSVALDPVGSISLQQLPDYDEMPPLAPEDGPNYTGGHPPLSSDSDTPSMVDIPSMAAYVGLSTEEQSVDDQSLSKHS